jgi:hypothetical protein
LWATALSALPTLVWAMPMMLTCQALVMVMRCFTTAPVATLKLALLLHQLLRLYRMQRTVRLVTLHCLLVRPHSVRVLLLLAWFGTILITMHWKLTTVQIGFLLEISQQHILLNT